MHGELSDARYKCHNTLHGIFTAFELAFANRAGYAAWLVFFCHFGTEPIPKGIEAEKGQFRTATTFFRGDLTHVASCLSSPTSRL
jgi:hypothetical protein